LHEGKILPTRAGIGLVLTALGALGCAAGLYAARHSQLSGGRLTFDAQARELIRSPGFARLLKWGGHAAGITLLLVSWLSVYYPDGIALQ